MTLVQSLAEAVVWPDHTQLPETDGSFVQNFQEHPQTILLTDSIQPWLDQLHPDGQYAIGQDSGIYWDLAASLGDDPVRGARAPDWFYVPGVPPLLEGQFRRSYVLWQERVKPLVLIEIVSGDGSEERDRTPRSGKFWIYERAIQARYYAIFEAERASVEVYELIEGAYRLVAMNGRGHFAIKPLRIELGIWRGNYRNMRAVWLRWWDSEGRLLPTGDERAEQERQRAEQEQQRAEEERQRAEQERQRAEQERQRAERLAEMLRSMGIDPDAQG